MVMRHSLLVTCLLLSAAWVSPAGSLIEPNSTNALAGASMVEKTTDGSAAERDAYTGPAETTQQLIDFDEVAIAPIPKDESRIGAESPAPPAGDALAALDAVADGFDGPKQRIPIPPHRAIPHTEVCEALASAAENNDVPTPFLIRLIWRESGFNQNVISPAGAIGVAQFMPETAAERGLDDPFNPLQAVRASARLLRDLIKQFGNVGLAAAAYNAGPRRVQDWLDKRGKLPQETQDYVQIITGKKAEEWKVKTASAAPIRVPERAPCQREAGLYAANGPAQIPLPPVQAKDEPVKVAKAPAAETKKHATAQAAAAKTAVTTTKTASAKSAAKPHKKEAVRQAMVIHPADQPKDQSKVDAPPHGKAQRTPAKNAAKAAGKGKKVKVADAIAGK
jgi:soluble lytic murein transglycosylase-like protein